MSKLITMYVLGFLFSENKRQVVLIKKTHPTWQAGMYNGVSGKVEMDERPEDAMRREFREEAGIDVTSWLHKGNLTGPDWHCYVYTAAVPVDLFLQVSTQTEERIIRHSLRRMDMLPLLPNVPSLIKLCLNTEEGMMFELAYADADTCNDTKTEQL